MLAAAAGQDGHVVGIDIGKVCIARAKRAGEKFFSESQTVGKESLPAVHFAVADAWDIPALLLLAPARDVIFVYSYPCEVFHPTGIQTIPRVSNHVLNY